MQQALSTSSFKKQNSDKHHFVKPLVCVLITLLLIGIGAHWLGKLVRPVLSDSSIVAVNSFHKLPENSVEVIGYGSSHMWRGMNPVEMYDSYGINAYNYGCNWQAINTTLLFLQDSLLTQKPKVALIETFMVGECEEDQDMDGEIYYTTALNEKKGKIAYLRQAFGTDKERYLSYMMPLTAFHDNWINISEASFKENNDTDFIQTRGFAPSDETNPITILDYHTFEQAPLPESSIQILDQITALCRENDIQIVYYTAPGMGPYFYSDAIQEYASENGAVYLNLFEHIDEMGIDENTDFYDVGHLNTKGANKVSDFLGQYLVENYELTDFR